jgi:hypothetical protein
MRSVLTHPPDDGQVTKKHWKRIWAFVPTATMRQREEMPLAQSQLGLSQKLRQLCHVPRYMPRLIARE